MVNEVVEESITKDGMLSVRLCEGCAQAIWGSAYFCAMYDSNAIGFDDIKALAKLATSSAEITNVLQLSDTASA